RVGSSRRHRHGPGVLLQRRHGGDVLAPTLGRRQGRGGRRPQRTRRGGRGGRGRLGGVRGRRRRGVLLQQLHGGEYLGPPLGRQQRGRADHGHGAGKRAGWTQQQQSYGRSRMVISRRRGGGRGVARA
ncbi:unnamed protein product, partial [Heterosigma akashiwo]